MNTKLERLCPETTVLAANMGCTVNHYAGRYFLLPGSLCLYDSRESGALSKRGAEVVCETLRGLSERAAVQRAAPTAERVLILLRQLAAARWVPGHYAMARGEPLTDTGTMDRAFGRYSFAVNIDGVRASGQGATRQEAVENLVAAAPASWGVIDISGLGYHP